MLASITWSLCLGLALEVSCAPSVHVPQALRRQSTDNFTSYSLPPLESSGLNNSVRASAIKVKADTFLYGPSIAGNTSFWPTGSLGNSTVNADYSALSTDSPLDETNVEDDVAVVTKTIEAAGGLKQLSDYELLYKNQWKKSLPEGVDVGVLTNYTNDLLFSMERLSVNPYSIKRLNQSDTLAFQVDNGTATNITGTTLSGLLNSGSLFYVDHRDQATLESTGRFAAYCDAYFYIHPRSGDFLPLAIRTNTGSNLIYTPADTSNDWLLAKMMFNLNDFWHSQWYHLGALHNVLEIIWEAAYRTLSDEHPIMALLKRLSIKIFGYRISAITNLINKGGLIDKSFAFTGAAAGVSTTRLYQSGAAGNFQSNYFYQNLQGRGLYNNTFGPKIKSYPFLEDASVIHTSIQSVITTFVDSYYTSPSSFQQDQELQAWIAEAKPAKIMDFPSSVDRQTLIDILTQFAFLGSAAHQTLNTNDLAEVKGTLPFHPASLYQAPPENKGVTDLMPFLPPANASIQQLVLLGLFARPNFVNSNVSLSQMFNDATMLGKMNTKVADASATFEKEMLAQSKAIAARSFDKDGLSQGMPFIWRSLDPQRAPYYLTI
ncbi:Manganese lipoxygenase [Lachnellula willkommii]|uniref:Manganese lipoxygenase n=1 Tax=Lachnellula willkommii TaxID=215461 RepID=A0A559MM73_9HELO|nr:Manganese lipoxygenase [Lachnellula willkommii]